MPHPLLDPYRRPSPALARREHPLRRPGVLLTACCLVAAALTACLPREATEVTLAQLAAFQSDYDGRRVITGGTLRTFPDPRHYWIEDGDLNRVELHGDESFDVRVGQAVRLRGRFAYDPEAGRSITVEAFLD